MARKRDSAIIMETENPNLEKWTKTLSVQFNSIIHHIAWNQGCRATMHSLTPCHDGDKGSARSYIMMYWARKRVHCHCFILSYYIFLYLPGLSLYLFIAIYVPVSFGCTCFKCLILEGRATVRPLLISFIYFPLCLHSELGEMAVPNYTWLWGDDACYSHSTFYLNMDRSRSDVSCCYWSSNRGWAVCFERQGLVDHSWPIVHKVKEESKYNRKDSDHNWALKQLLFSVTQKTRHVQWPVAQEGDFGAILFKTLNWVVKIGSSSILYIQVYKSF